MLQKIRLASRNILGGAAVPTDTHFDRAKQQWLSLEASIRLLKTEATTYKAEMRGIGQNGADMMNKIAAMFDDSNAALPAPASSPPGGVSPAASADAESWPDPNDNHPYKDVAALMQQMQGRILQEDIAYSERHLETRMIAKLDELLIKFNALKDRIAEREKLRAEVDSLLKQVDASKQRSASSLSSASKRSADPSGSQSREQLEAQYAERKEEYTVKHAALLRELQQYNENRLDILAALLLDFFAAQKFFAYAYGRSLHRLHEQLQEADECSAMPLPKPSWQALMTYVTQTEERRTLQTGEVRPSLIMKMASEEYEGGAVAAQQQQRQQQRAAAATAASPPPPAAQPPPPAPRPPPPSSSSSSSTSSASSDDIDFDPQVLHDPKNQPYLPLSVMMNLRERREAKAAAGESVTMMGGVGAGEPLVRKGGPPPALAEPPQVSVTAFPALHAAVNREGKAPEPPPSSSQPPADDVWGVFGAPPPSASQPTAGRQARQAASAELDLFSLPFPASSPPAAPSPPHQPPAASPPPPPASRPGAPPPPPPPPASRQPPLPASRANINTALSPNSGAGAQQAASPVPLSPPAPRGAPPPPASRAPSMKPAAAAAAAPSPAAVVSTNPWDAPAFPQPPPPSSRPPPSPSQALSPRATNGAAFGFPAPPPPPPQPRAAQPQKPAPPKKKEWTPFDDEED